MKTQKFQMETAIRFGVETVRKNFVFLAGVVLFVGLIGYIPMILNR